MYFFSLKIKEIRKSKGLSQNDMAKLLNVKRQAYAKMESESNNIKVNSMIEIANILNVSLDDLVEFKKIHKLYSDEIKNKMNK